MTGFCVKKYISFFLLAILCLSSYSKLAIAGRELPEPLTEKVILPPEEKPKEEEVQQKTEEEQQEAPKDGKPQTRPSCKGPPTLLERGETTDPFKGSFLEFESYDTPKNVYDFSFISKDRKTIKLSDYKGKYVLLHFWATWCNTCVKELPSIVTLQETLKEQENFAILPIATDIKRPIVALRGFLDRHDVKGLPLFYDREIDIQRHFAIGDMPSSYILNPEGRILHKMSGPTDWTKPEAIDFIKDVISQ